MIVGRENEIADLNRVLNSGKPEFVAVYGRRRVGKTYLIDQVCRETYAFRHAGSQPDESKDGRQKKNMQLNAFRDSLIRYGASKAIPKFTSWGEAFFALEELLNNIPSNQRYVVFIDEMPWMDTPKSGFLNALSDFWNNYGCIHDNMVLIACGSASSWILDNLIRAKGGLYDRVTFQLRLQPFSLKECKQLLESNRFEWSDYEITEIYMALGGIPYYFNYLHPERSVAENIDSLFFRKAAPFENEFETLFSSQFAHSDTYRSLIEAIGQKNIGLSRSEIEEATGIRKGGTLSEMLKALEQGEFIMAYVPFGGNKREPLYKLIDPFCLFYLKHVKGNQGHEGYWKGIDSTPKANTWKGLAFENVCFNHIKQIQFHLGIAGVACEASLLCSDERKAQIDLVLKRGDGVVNLCEAKFYSNEYRADLESHLNLDSKKEAIRNHMPKKYSIRTVLLTTFGMRRGEYASDYGQVLTLSALFS